MSRPRLLDLFSGIGGFSLGLERAGFETVAFCEIDPFCRRVLAEHWPEVPQYDDVAAADFAAIGSVDLVAAGFPCQDISNAGRGAGLAGSRSGLFWHVIRTAGMVGRPRLLLENVAALLRRGMGWVLGAMATFGYDAEWHCIPAANAGAPDIRDRVWIIANPQHPDPYSLGSHSATFDLKRGPELRHQQDGVAGPLLSALPRRGERLGSGTFGHWCPEPGIRRVAERTPEVVDRVRALGNTVKPVIPEIIGRAILSAEAASRLERAA